MVVRYPDILKFSTIPVDSVYDQETGTWSSLEESENLELRCRAEMNGAGRTVPSSDGEQLEYSYIVYLVRNCPVFMYGQSVEVHNDDGLLVTANVKKFSRNQFNARVWV